MTTDRIVRIVAGSYSAFPQLRALWRAVRYFTIAIGFG